MLSLTGCATRCDNKDPIPEPTQLPPITTDGKNTFGFKIDNKIYVSQSIMKGMLGGYISQSGIEIIDYKDSTLKIYAGYFNASLKEYNSWSLDFKLNKVKMRFGINTFAGNNFGVVFLNSENKIYFSNSSTTSFIDFKRIDFNQSIYSGTFDLFLQDTITKKIVHLTEGRFDVNRKIQ